MTSGDGDRGSYSSEYEQEDKFLSEKDEDPEKPFKNKTALKMP